MNAVQDVAIVSLARRVAPNATVLRTWELKGGISARTLAFELALADGSRRRYVARSPGVADGATPDVGVEDEFRLLSALHVEGMPVPTPLFCEPWSAALRAPVIILEYIEGDIGVGHRDAPLLMQEYAAHLATIHRVDWRRLGLDFLPGRSRGWTQRLAARPATLDDSLDEGAIRDLLEPIWPLRECNASVLLHGDFWPGNVLWRDDNLAAVIDWEDAAIGDPLSDLAITRLELLWRFDFAAADAFTQHYRALTSVDLDPLPYWDLCAALRPAGAIDTWADTPAASHMRAKHREFVQRAIDTLRSDGRDARL